MKPTPKRQARGRKTRLIPAPDAAGSFPVVAHDLSPEGRVKEGTMRVDRNPDDLRRQRQKAGEAASAGTGPPVTRARAPRSAHS